MCAVRGTGNWQRAAAVLFERHSLSGHLAPSRQARKGTASGAASGTRAGGWPADVSPTLNACFGSKQGLEDQHIAGGGDCLSPPIAMCLITKTRLDSETETLIPTIGGGFDVAGTLGNRGLRSHTKLDGHGAYIPVAHPISFGAQMSVPQTDVDMVQTLQAKNPMAVAFGGDIARSLTARYDSSPCVDREMDVVATAMQVRRLTPVECERLQGFPDGYTNIPWRGKPESPDGPRYKALGNSMAVPVMSWIGERINKVEAL